MTSRIHMERLGGEADRAAFDAIKHLFVSVENPRGYAIWLAAECPQLADALRGAIRGTLREERGYWIVQDEKMRPYLVKLGLVPVRERRLSNYGTAVRNWLVGEVEDDAL